MLVAARDRISAFAGIHGGHGLGHMGAVALMATVGQQVSSGFIGQPQWVIRKMRGHWNRVIQSMEQSGTATLVDDNLGSSLRSALRIYPFALLQSLGSAFNTDFKRP